jgi:hypothetical protein
MRLPAIFALLGLLIVQSADAADPTQIIGKWVSHPPNGATMMVEFTATTFSFHAVDSSGGPKTERKTYEVTYKDLGDSIAIEYKDHAGGAMAVMKDRQSATLVFPGSGAFPLSRIQP